MAKKNAVKAPAPVATIENCTFTVMPESADAVVARADAIRAVADCLAKVADALKAGTNSAPVIQIK